MPAAAVYVSASAGGTIGKGWGNGWVGRGQQGSLLFERVPEIPEGHQWLELALNKWTDKRTQNQKANSRQESPGSHTGPAIRLSPRGYGQQWHDNQVKQQPCQIDWLMESYPKPDPYPLHREGYRDHDPVGNGPFFTLIHTVPPLLSSQATQNRSSYRQQLQNDLALKAVK